jgi:hypothetical protein
VINEAGIVSGAKNIIADDNEIEYFNNRDTTHMGVDDNDMNINPFNAIVGTFEDRSIGNDNQRLTSSTLNREEYGVNVRTFSYNYSSRDNMNLNEYTFKSKSSSTSRLMSNDSTGQGVETFGRETFGITMQITSLKVSTKKSNISDVVEKVQTSVKRT